MGNCQNLPDSDTKKPGHKSKGNSQYLFYPFLPLKFFSVIVSTFTWSRDSHGLFDYESKTLVKKVLKVQASGRSFLIFVDFFQVV